MWRTQAGKANVPTSPEQSMGVYSLNSGVRQAWVHILPPQVTRYGDSWFTFLGLGFLSSKTGRNNS